MLNKLFPSTGIGTGISAVGSDPMWCCVTDTKSEWWSVQTNVDVTGCCRVDRKKTMTPSVLLTALCCCLSLLKGSIFISMFYIANSTSFLEVRHKHSYIIWCEELLLPQTSSPAALWCVWHLPLFWLCPLKPAQRRQRRLFLISAADITNAGPGRV